MEKHLRIIQECLFLCRQMANMWQSALVEMVTMGVALVMCEGIRHGIMMQCVLDGTIVVLIEITLWPGIFSMIPT